MRNAVDFIKYALTHAKRESIPKEAKLPLDIEDCGGEPWEYLYGTTGCLVTKALLEERYKNFYSKKGWTREAFDLVTYNWAELKKKAVDCEGLLDSFLGEDVTANYCYTGWCTERGAIADVERPYEIGEALFYQNADGRMTHVGFVCGFLKGEPLAVEARGIRFGVVVSTFSERPWTHRGKVTARLSYDNEFRDEPITLSITKPMIQGDMIKHLQKAFNALGYYSGPADGKCGKLTMNGVREFVKAHADA